LIGDLVNPNRHLTGALPFLHTKFAAQSRSWCCSILVALLAYAAGTLLLPAQTTNGLINSFESNADLSKFTASGTTVSLSTAGVTDGQKAAAVAFSHTSWPGLHFEFGTGFTNTDWSSWVGLAVDVLNTNSMSVTVDFRIDDSYSANGIIDSYNGTADAPAGQETTLVLPFPKSVLAGMNAQPPLASNALTMVEYGSALNWSNIVALDVFLPLPTNQVTLFFDNIRLLPASLLTGLVDQFGQFTRADWPGKVHQNSDFTNQLNTEQAWFAAHPKPADRDGYGGWMNGSQLNATGFFRTAFVVNGQEVNVAAASTNQGRWWLVDPAGALFISLGVDVMVYGETTSVTSRESLFSWLPGAGDPLLQFSEPGANRTADFYNMNLYRKYGTNWNNLAHNQALNRLLSWGFNTVGIWSSTDLDTQRVPYTMNIWYDTSDVATFTSAAQKMVDPFDAGFTNSLTTWAASTMAASKNDPWCLGYCVDDELPWAGWSASQADQYALPVGVLSYNGYLPAKGAFAKLMQSRYSTVAQLNAAWNTSVASWSTFSNQVVTLPATWTAACVTDLGGFLTNFADRYFSAVRTIIKHEAPNQLYLGCPFASQPVGVVNVAAQYCDAIGFDIYERILDPAVWAFTSSLNKPCFVGQYQFGALDRGMFSPGLVLATNQTDRGQAYQEYLRSLLSLPAFVGCHWFQYFDEPLVGRFDGENYNDGLVSSADTPYWEILTAAQQINAQVYSAFTSPQLSISATTNTVTLTWPFLANGFTLKWQTDLLSDAPWQPLNGQINQVGAENIMSLTVSNSSGFYRLDKP
jgi:hypothetical protein